MSISRAVYVRRESVPSPKAWAEAIRAAGFPMEMDTDFDIENVSGFLPCRYEGKESGFEYFFSTIREDNEDEEDFALPDVGDRDICISFVTHSSMRGLATAVVAAAVLCEKTNGILHDEEADELISAGAAIASARELLAEIGDDLE